MNSVRNLSVNDKLGLPASLIRAWRSARYRATRHGRPFTLSLDDLYVLWERCDGRCVVSGVELTGEEPQASALVKRPFQPSIDQIDPTKGYTLQNTRITCVAANFAMNEWGLDTLRRLARGVVQKAEEEARGNEQWYRRQTEKLREAEQALPAVTGVERMRMERRVAGIKAALTLGPVRLAEIAGKAQKKRRENQMARAARAT